MPDKPLAIIRAEESALEVPSPINSYQYGAGTNVETENQLLAYWRLIMARKWIVVGAFALVFTFVAVATYRLTPRYTATASIVTNLPSSAYLPQAGYGVQDLRVQEVTSNIQTQMDILSSRAMAERVVKKMNLVQRPEVGGPLPPSATEEQIEARRKGLIGFVSGGLSVKPRRGSRLIDLAFESSSPTLSAEVLNAVCTEFISYDLETRTNTTSHAAEWLQSELGGLKTKMEESQVKLVDYAKEHPILTMMPAGDKGTASTVEQDRVAQLSKQYMDAESNRMAIESKYLLAKENNLVSMTDTPNPTLQALMAKRTELNQKLLDAEQEYQPTSPQVQALQEALTAIQKEIENTKTTVSHDSLAKLEADYNTAKLNEQKRKELFEHERTVALEENGHTVQYELLKQDADANEKLYNNLLQRLKEAQLSMGLQDPSARIVDTAQIPQFRSYPPVTRNLMMGGILGLGFGIGLVFLLDYLDNTLKTTDDVNRILQLSALGIIPALGTLNKRRLLGTGAGGPSTSAELISEHSADSGYAEAYRSL